MDETPAFSPRFIGMKVAFTKGATWELTEKVSDEFYQHTKQDFEELGGKSTAYGTFLCRNADNSMETATMRVFMQ
jgi:hypothetical protein